MRKTVFIATGAYDTGKTATLDFLRDFRGTEVHGEAYLEVMNQLSHRTQGHDEDQPFSKLAAPGHFCAMCNPEKFRDLVLQEQFELEQRTEEFAVLERGYVDPWEMFTRNTDAEAKIPLNEAARFSNYALVFLFTAMPELQTERWGKSVALRTEEALRINQRLKRLYTSEGVEVVEVPPGSVESRASFVFDEICIYRTSCGED